jgi:hypothetical protein
MFFLSQEGIENGDRDNWHDNCNTNASKHADLQMLAEMEVLQPKNIKRSSQS